MIFFLDVYPPPEKYNDFMMHPKKITLWEVDYEKNENYCSGYCLTNTLTPDAYTVNADGAWTIYGQVQTKNLSSENTVTSDFPKLDGLYHDTNWNHYYLVHTKEDGTLLVYLRNADGSEGELYMEMTYLGDNRWSDGNGSVLSNNAWVTEGENFHVSMGGYVQREMIKQ